MYIGHGHLEIRQGREIQVISTELVHNMTQGRETDIDLLGNFSEGSLCHNAQDLV